MIRTGGCLKIIEVAIDAIVADAVETELCFGGVAVGTGNNSVGAQERESVVDVQFGDVVDEPVVGCMASRAIHAHCLLVHVGMAADTSRISFVEDERCMTIAAVDQGVLAGQGEEGGIVIEAQLQLFTGRSLFVRGRFLPGSRGNSPAGCRMAVATVQLERFAVWRLCVVCQAQSQKKDYR